ncbi:MAG: hypothetical protein JW779_11445 [Candidatus Thorarchaeota archaeon]|nr:hypothetical protein [Candidatus Thorarchaeota archaeon]
MNLNKALRCALGVFILVLVVSAQYQHYVAAEPNLVDTRTDLSGIKVCIYMKGHPCPVL